MHQTIDKPTSVSSLLAASCQARRQLCYNLPIRKTSKIIFWSWIYQNSHIPGLLEPEHKFSKYWTV